jgi:hypothetical protein
MRACGKCKSALVDNDELTSGLCFMCLWWVEPESPDVVQWTADRHRLYLGDHDRDLCPACEAVPDALV